MTRQRFADKIMVVTGAAQGIGQRVASCAAAEGASVVLADRAPFLADVTAEIAAAGGRVLAVTADLETYQGAETVMTRAAEAFGRIDILVNNVGGTIWAKPYAEYRDRKSVV